MHFLFSQIKQRWKEKKKVVFLEGRKALVAANNVIDENTINIFKRWLKYAFVDTLRPRIDQQF